MPPILSRELRGHARMARGRLVAESRSALIAFALSMTLWVQFSAVQPVSAFVFPCATAGNFYGQAMSGTGSTWGTEMVTNLPASVYAPDGAATDEAAWIYNQSIVGQSNSGVELGWFNGTWPYNSDFGYVATQPTGYITFDGGTNLNLGFILTGQLPFSKQFAFVISNAEQGGVLHVIINDFTDNLVWYSTTEPQYYVKPNRTNMSQGEVTYNGQGAWMGGNGGNGTTSWGYYEPANAQMFSPWGGYTPCDNSPYWINTLSNSSWKNGGS
jgi:hypothetical protein